MCTFKILEEFGFGKILEKMSGNPVYNEII